MKKDLIIGFVIGFILGGGIVFAANRQVTLQSGNGQELGTVANPLYITSP